jgi:hypothetical protein
MDSQNSKGMSLTELEAVVIVGEAEIKSLEETMESTGKLIEEIEWQIVKIKKAFFISEAEKQTLVEQQRSYIERYKKIKANAEEQIRLAQEVIEVLKLTIAVGRGEKVPPDVLLEIMNPGMRN